MITEFRGRVKTAGFTLVFLLIPVNAVGQTVQQAAEQAKDAGQKGTVVSVYFTNVMWVKSQTGPPTLPCPLSYTRWERERYCSDATVTFVFFCFKSSR